MHSLNDVRQRVHLLTQELAAAGEADAARRLEEALTDFYTTSTEALIGIVQALADTQESWTQRLDARRQREIQELQTSARAMLNLA